MLLYLAALRAATVPSVWYQKNRQWAAVDGRARTTAITRWESGPRRCRASGVGGRPRCAPAAGPLVLPRSPPAGAGLAARAPRRTWRLPCQLRAVLNALVFKLPLHTARVSPTVLRGLHESGGDRQGLTHFWLRLGNRLFFCPSLVPSLSLCVGMRVQRG